LLNNLPLLERAHLIRVNRHRHRSGMVHSHPHLLGLHEHGDSIRHLQDG